MKSRSAFFIGAGGVVIIAAAAWLYAAHSSQLVVRERTENSPSPSSEEFLGFTHDGEPIHPDCVSRALGDNPENTAIEVNLESCTKEGKAKEANASASLEISKLVTGVPRAEMKYGIVKEGDYEYHAGHFAYDILAREGDNYLLSTDSDGGGTGQFTSLVIVRKDGDTIALSRSLAAGDRCSGGVYASEVKNGKAKYFQYIGIPGIAALSEGRMGEFGSPPDCAAWATYEFSLKDGDPTFSSVEIPITAERTSTYLPECFANFVQGYADMHPGLIITESTRPMTRDGRFLSLPADALKDFAGRYKLACPNWQYGE